MSAFAHVVFFRSSIAAFQVPHAAIEKEGKGALFPEWGWARDVPFDRYLFTQEPEPETQAGGHNSWRWG